MAITGSSVNDPNYILRFSVIVFSGIILFGVAISWRASLLMANDYQEMPITHEQLKIRKENEQKRLVLEKKLLKKYQLEE